MVYVLLGTGFEEMEAITPVDLLRRAGIDVLTVGLGGEVIAGSHGIGVKADIPLSQVDLTALDMVVVPGGLKGVRSIRADRSAMELLRYAWDNGKFVAAICAGPTVLAELGITRGRNVTCYPGFEQEMDSAVTVPDAACVRDGNLITGTSAGCAIPFALALVAALRGQAAADTVAAQIVLR